MKKTNQGRFILMSGLKKKKKKKKKCLKLMTSLVHRQVNYMVAAFIKVVVTTRLFLKLQPPSLHPLFTLGWEVNARVAIFHQPNDRLLLSEYCICTIIIVHTATMVNALMSSLMYTRMYPSKVQSVRQECQVLVSCFQLFSLVTGSSNGGKSCEVLL